MAAIAANKTASFGTVRRGKLAIFQLRWIALNVKDRENDDSIFLYDRQ